jgi:hypothetical protein
VESAFMQRSNRINIRKLTLSGLLARFSGLILPAGLKQSIWGLEEAEFPKRRAAGFTLSAALCLTGNLRLGDDTA